MLRDVLNVSSDAVQKLGLIPVVVLAFLFGLMIVFNLGEAPVFKSPYLLLILNTLFLAGTGLLVAVISARIYLKEGSISLLLLGMATTAGGLAAAVAGWGANFSVNANVAIFNLGFLFAGGLQLLSAVIVVVGSAPIKPSYRKADLLIGYSAVVGVIVVASTLVLSGYSPEFFSSSGPTLTRQWILGIATTIFVTSSLMFGWHYVKSKSQIVYWYSLGLALLALALFGSATYTVPNAPFNWAARLAQYLGGFFFLAAVLVSMRKEGVDSASYAVNWAEAFKSDRGQLDILFGKMIDAFSYHRIICDASGKPVDYVFLDVNEAFEQVTGLSKQKVLGKRVTEVLPGIENDPADWIRVYGHVALTGESIRFDNYSVQLKKWFSVSAYSSRKGYFVALFDDITERRKAEKALEESEHLYRTLFDNSQDGFQLIELIYDENGKPVDNKFLKVNSAYEKIIGVKAEIILDKTARYISPNDEPHWFEVPDRVLKTGKSEHVELYNKGINKTLDCYFFPYAENVVGTLFRDVTQRKCLEKQLQDSERLATIGATAGMVGHDIRNPLQAITGDLYLAKTELASIPESEQKKDALESLQEIEKNVDYINKIVADLQDFAKPLNPRFEETDLKFAIDELLAKTDFSPNITVNVEVEENARKLTADSSYISRIMYNLVTNAVQAMPKGGNLTIHVYRVVKETVIAVKDTGVGIPEAVKGKLFTPMFTTKAKGQGFGLAVIKRMTEALGGTVSFQSQEGKGTIFTVRFPSPQEGKEKSC